MAACHLPMQRKGQEDPYSHHQKACPAWDTDRNRWLGNILLVGYAEGRPAPVALEVKQSYYQHRRCFVTRPRRDIHTQTIEFTWWSPSRWHQQEESAALPVRAVLEVLAAGS